MSIYIRYDCVTNSPLRVLIERLDDHAIFDASTGMFTVVNSGAPVPDSMFMALSPDVPLPNLHSATIDISDPNQFRADSAFGYYTYSGANRISDLQPLYSGGSKVVVMVDGEVVFTT